MKAKLAVVLVVLASVLAMAGPASADPSGLINHARVHTNSRHPEGTQLAWAVAQVKRSTVTAINTAKATDRHCTDCVAEAVAFQVVLASDTHIYVLTNNATSINTECETCTAVSVAEQWVAGATDGTIVLSAAGQSALEAVQAQLVSDMALPPQSGLQAILGAADEVSAILAADLSITPNKSPPSPSPLTEVTPLFSPPPTVQHFAQVNG
jgi:hypothetical protein